jgi:hypothetical protein
MRSADVGEDAAVIGFSEGANESETRVGKIRDG